MRMRGHAQHDPAEYVPKEMRAYWEARDPILLYEKFLAKEKILDDKSQKEIGERIEALLNEEREFAENSPMPPPEFAETGVYCTGDNCHKIRPKWERPIAEVTPPKSSVSPVWTVPGFGSGKSSASKTAAIHFGDTQQPSASELQRKSSPNGKPPAAGRKSAKSAGASGPGKARR